MAFPFEIFSVDSVTCSGAERIKTHCVHDSVLAKHYGLEVKTIHQIGAAYVPGAYIHRNRSGGVDYNALEFLKAMVKYEDFSKRFPGRPLISGRR